MWPMGYVKILPIHPTVTMTVVTVVVQATMTIVVSANASLMNMMSSTQNGKEADAEKYVDRSHRYRRRIRSVILQFFKSQ